MYILVFSKIILYQPLVAGSLTMSCRWWIRSISPWTTLCSPYNLSSLFCLYLGIPLALPCGATWPTDLQTSSWPAASPTRTLWSWLTTTSNSAFTSSLEPCCRLFFLQTLIRSFLTAILALLLFSSNYCFSLVLVKKRWRKNWERISAFSHLSNNGCSKHCQSLQPQLSLIIPCQNSFSLSNTSTTNSKNILNSKPVFTEYKLYRPNSLIALKLQSYYAAKVFRLIL